MSAAVLLPRKWFLETLVGPHLEMFKNRNN